MKDRRDIPAYTMPEAAHYLGLPTSTLRSWFAGQPYIRGGVRRHFQRVITPADPKALSLSFSNLVEAYVLSSIRRKHHIPLPKVRTALSFLSNQFGSRRPLLEEQFATDGIDLFVEKLGAIINISRHGQMEMADVIRAYIQRIDRDPRGIPLRLFPLMRSTEPAKQPRTVVIDPAIAFGRPVVAGTAIPTAVLAEQFKAGDSVETLAREYAAPPEGIWDAIRCELELQAA